MASQRWLKPVWEQMHTELIASPVIHADETVVQVLHKPGKKAKTDSCMWVYRAQHKKANIGKVDCCAREIASQSPNGNILFEYRPTRSGDHAARFLGDYSGYIVCDGRSSVYRTSGDSCGISD